MISIVTSFLNCRFDFEQLVRQLHQLNDPTAFEICVCHDNRVDDDSADALAALCSEFDNVKACSWDQKDMEDYLTGVLAARGQHWPADVLASMQERLVQFKAGTLCDPTKSVLWVSPAPLLTAAAGLATGDYLLFLPADTLLGFRLADLEAWAATKIIDGALYAPLNVAMLASSNLEEERLHAELLLIKQQIEARRLKVESSSVHPGIFRVYERWNSDLNTCRIVAGPQETAVTLTDAQFVTSMALRFDYLAIKEPKLYRHSLNGYHLVSRQTWAATGFPAHGFERDVPFVVLTKSLASANVGQMPTVFSAILSKNHTAVVKDACVTVDAKHDKHPLPGFSSPTYLWKMNDWLRLYDAIKVEYDI